MGILVPYVIETTDRGERGMDIYSRLLRDRIVFLGTPIDDAVGIAQVLFRGERSRLGPGVLAIHALILEVGEIDGALGHGEGAPTILVDARPDVERRRSHVGGQPVGRAAHHHVPAPLLRTRLHPVDIVAVQGDLSKADRAGDYEIGRDGRFPGPKRHCQRCGQGRLS